MRLDRIKLICEMAKQDMTAIQLAKLSGVARATITGVRSGKSCNDQTGAKIARALGVDINELMEN